MVKLNQILKQIQKDNLEEGWKENLLFTAAMVLSGLGLKAQAQKLADVPSKPPIEVVKKDPDQAKKVYALMIQASQEMLWSAKGKLSIEEMAAIKEVTIYFQDLRDGRTPEPLSKMAKLVIDHLSNVLKNAPASEIERLKHSGMTANVMENSTKLKYILKEVLDDPKKVKGYDLIGPSVAREKVKRDGTQSVTYRWSFKNVKAKKNPNMEIVIEFEYDTEFKDKKNNPSMIITFYKKGQSFDYMTGAGDITKVMKTVITAAENTIKAELGDSATKDDLYRVGYQPADDRRDRIYNAFIGRYYKEFTPEKKKKEDTEEKEDTRSVYKWYVNNNYRKPTEK